MFTKDSYIWFSPQGEMFDALRSDHKGTAIHECWAQEYLTKDMEGAFWQRFDQLVKLREEAGCEYSYEYLEKQGWLRYLPWVGSFSTFETNKHLYTHAIKKAVRGFCLDNGVKLPEELDTHE